MYLLENSIAQISIDSYIKDYRDTDKFLGFCKACNKFGNCWSCPPYNFSTDEYLDNYRYAYIIGTKIIPSDELADGCKSIDDSIRIGRQLIKDVRKSLDAKLIDIENDHTGSKAFFAGTCHVCDVETCTRIVGEPCRFPDKIRYSLESFGFDIGKTTSQLLDIELKWSKDGSLPQYLTLVSALLANDDNIDLQAYF